MPGGLAETLAPWKVEVDFVNGPTSTTFTWTDITRYVVDWSTKRGRQYELSRSETGTLSLTLENVDGRFDPSNTATPYGSGNLVPMRRVRISSTFAGQTNGLFMGYIERWPQEWEGGLGSYGLVQVTAVDGFRALAAVEFGDAWAEQVESSQPWIWDRLDDNNVEVIPNGASLQILNDEGSPSPTSLVQGNSNPSRQWDNRTSGTNPVRYVQVNSNATTYTLTCLFRGDAAAASTAGSGHVSVILNNQGTNPVFGFEWRRAASGGMELAGRYFDVNANATAYVTLAATPLGTTYHLAATRDGSALRWYVNGALAGSVTSTANYALSNPSVGLGQGTVPAAWVIDEWQVHLRALAPSQIQQQHKAALAPATTFREFGQANTAQRVHDVLDSISWPAGQRVIYTGTQTVQGTGSIKGKTALAVIQDAEAAEIGSFFMDGLGRAVFLERFRQNNASSVGTLGDGVGEVSYDADIGFDYDDTNLVNEVTITQENVAPPVVVTLSDATSQARYFRRTSSMSAPYTTEQAAVDTATELLRRYKDPHLRCPQVTIDPGTDRDAFTPALRWELGDKVLVRRRPRYGPPITLTAVIEGVAHTVTPGSWKTTFQLSPVV